MNVRYGVQAPGEIVTPCESMAEALAMATPEDKIWLLDGARTLVELPLAFNRCVNVNGNKINSAVLRGAEVNRHGNELPLPDSAPFLVIDVDRSDIDWLPNGIGGPVVHFRPKGEG
jgi:hypothetical protein